MQSWFPAHEVTPDASNDWTYDKQLLMAEQMAKAGYPIGFGCGQNSTNSNQTWGATFGAFGADLVNAKGEITIDSDNVMQAMEYCQKMVKFMPADAIQWDDASNNRALISGKAALIRLGARISPMPLRLVARRVLCDPDGDRHSEPCHPVENVACSLRLGLLIGQNPSVEPPTNDGLVAIHRGFDQAPTAVA